MTSRKIHPWNVVSLCRSFSQIYGIVKGRIVLVLKGQSREIDRKKRVASRFPLEILVDFSESTEQKPWKTIGKLTPNGSIFVMDEWKNKLCAVFCVSVYVSESQGNLWLIENREYIAIGIYTYAIVANLFCSPQSQPERMERWLARAAWALSSTSTDLGAQAFVQGHS